MSADYDPSDAVRNLMRVSGLGRETVKACIRTGSLPGYYTGTRYVLPEEAFRAFCEGRWVAQHRPVFSEPIKPIGPLVRKIAS